MIKKMEQLEAEYRELCAATGGEPIGEYIDFDDVGDGGSVYNISQRFCFGGYCTIAGRAEPISDEHASKIVFYRENRAGRWERVPGVEFEAQDPSVSFFRLRGNDGRMCDHLILNGVHAVPIPPDENGVPQSSYYLRAWIGASLETMVALPDGPPNQKGTRYVDLGGGDLGVFVRPQGALGGLGKIGFARVHADTIEDLQRALTPDSIAAATRMIDGLCVPEEWVGPNQAFPLSDGRIGVIGHIARWRVAPPPASLDRQYDAMSFIYDPRSGEVADLRIIATVNSFDPDRGATDAGVDAKRPDLRWVLYPGGLERFGNGRAMLYCGIGDLHAGRVEIPDPFAGR